jgi:hypothetical protein
VFRNYTTKAFATENLTPLIVFSLNALVVYSVNTIGVYSSNTFY